MHRKIFCIQLPAMAKPGRPKQNPKTNVSAVLTARVTAAERKACVLAAKRDGVKLSAWVRQTLLGAAVGQSKRD